MKKSFCDGWDNLLSLVITNVVFLMAGFGCVYLFAFSAAFESYIVLGLAFVISSIILSIIAFAYGDLAAEISNFNGVSVAAYFKAIPGVLKDASLFGLMISGITIISVFSIKYYLIDMQSYIGIFLGGFIIWIDIFLMLSLQWFIPIRSLMHNNFRKCLKKSLIIFFDNTGFSILVGLYTILNIAVSVACIGFFPSIAGILVNTTNALRIRLYKYDYLEEHPELQTKKEKRNIPWEELIYEDRETLGPRKLKSFLFPWKEEER